MAVRWFEVREGDVLEWLDSEDDVHLVLESSYRPCLRTGKPGYDFKLLCLTDGQVLGWHSSEAVNWAGEQVGTLQELQVRLWRA